MVALTEKLNLMALRSALVQQTLVRITLELSGNKPYAALPLKGADILA